MWQRERNKKWRRKKAVINTAIFKRNCAAAACLVCFSRRRCDTVLESGWANRRHLADFEHSAMKDPTCFFPLILCFVGPSLPSAAAEAHFSKVSNWNDVGKWFDRNQHAVWQSTYSVFNTSSCLHPLSASERNATHTHFDCHFSPLFTNHVQCWMPCARFIRPST